MNKSHTAGINNVSITGRYGLPNTSFVSSGAQDVSQLYLTGFGKREAMLAQAVSKHSVEKKQMNAKVQCKCYLTFLRNCRART